MMVARHTFSLYLAGMGEHRGPGAVDITSSQRRSSPPSLRFDSPRSDLLLAGFETVRIKSRKCQLHSGQAFRPPRSACHSEAGASAGCLYAFSSSRACSAGFSIVSRNMDCSKAHDVHRSTNSRRICRCCGETHVGRRAIARSLIHA